MRIEALLLLLLSCIPSNTIINLPDRTSVGQPPPHYDPCVRSYAQQAQFGIEERICVDSMGNTNIREYWDTIREYPCTWQITKDGKTRCIPAQQLGGYYANVESFDGSSKWILDHVPECLDPIVLMETDPFQHPRSWYVGVADHKGRYSVYEVGRRMDMHEFWLPYWNEQWEEWECTSLLPIDLFYPITPKGHAWFLLGREVEPALFQERK